MPNILIVEDEPKMRRLLEISLGEDGHAVTAVPDAETGLKFLQREPVDLVLTDLKLPGMSGLEFLQEARRINAAVPMLVMTAYGSVETAVEAIKARAGAHVLQALSLDGKELQSAQEIEVHRGLHENP